MLAALAARVTPPPELVLKMRWVLEWRFDEDAGEKKAKARIVILGFQDREYELRPTTAPTMMNTSRNRLLQLSAWLAFKMRKGDLSAAFTQSRKLDRELYGLPPPDLARVLGIPEGEAARLLVALYSLVGAALEWYFGIGETLTEYGWTQMRMEPCTWVVYGENRRKTNLTKQFLL